MLDRVRAISFALTGFLRRIYLIPSLFISINLSSNKVCWKTLFLINVSIFAENSVNTTYISEKMISVISSYVKEENFLQLDIMDVKQDTDVVFPVGYCDFLDENCNNPFVGFHGLPSARLFDINNDSEKEVIECLQMGSSVSSLEWYFFNFKTHRELNYVPPSETSTQRWYIEYNNKNYIVSRLYNKENYIF